MKKDSPRSKGILLWTKKKPTKSGFYWIRGGVYEAQVVWVSKSSFPGTKGRRYVRFARYDECDDLKYFDDFEWAGPIQSPMTEQEWKNRPDRRMAK